MKVLTPIATSPLTAMILIIALLFSYLLSSGLIMDDTFRSYVSAVVELRGLGFWGNLKFENLELLHKMGRIFPLNFWNVFYFFDSVVAYKAFSLGCFVTSCVIFALFLKELEGSLAKAVVTTLISVSFIQVRYTHDPLLSYYGLLPQVLIWISSSWLFWLKFLRSKRIVFAYISILFLVVGCLTYEICYLMSLGHLALSWHSAHTRIQSSGLIKRASLTLKSACFPILVTGCFILMIIVLKQALGITGTRSSYAINLEPPAVLRTFATQFVGVFPLSYRYSTSAINPDGLAGFFTHSSYEAIFLFCTAIIAFAGLLFSSLRTISDGSYNSLFGDRSNSLLLQLGIILLIVPSLPLSVAVRYQTELQIGLPYLPIFISYFGFGCIVAALVTRLIELLSSNPTSSFCFILFATVVFTGFTVIHYVDGYWVVFDRTNPSWKYPRDTITSAAKAGALTRVKDDESLFLKSPYPWEWTFSKSELFDARTFYKSIRVDVAAVYSAADVNIMPSSSAKLAGLSPLPQQMLIRPRKSHFIDYASLSASSGYALAAKVDYLLLEQNRAVLALADGPLTVYVKFPLRAQNAVHLVADVFSKNGDDKTRRVWVEGIDFTTRLDGPSEKMFDIAITNGFIDLNSIRIGLHPSLRQDF